MYENETYEVIMERMLGRVVKDYPEIDIREGSVMWTALSPAAIELAYLYTQLDNTLKESFVETASREYIFLKCKETGIDTSVFEASNAIFSADFNVEVEIGSRWNYDKYNFVVTEYIGVVDGRHRYHIMSETAGSEVNGATGAITPIDTAQSGLDYAVIVACEIYGEDEWSDDAIRDYYYDQINKTAIDGNVKQYQQWCSEFEGIGNYKVFPLWNGVNTVKVSILNAENGAASDELIEKFQTYLDPGITGMGDGMAPIGAFVTVSTATEVPITIGAKVLFKSGYSDTAVIDTALREYFKSIAYKSSTVSYMGVGATLMNAEGIDYITDLTINGGTSDVSLGNEEIPVLSTTDWTVV